MAELFKEGETRRVRVGLLGCGNVGAALVDILQRDRGSIAARSGLELDISAIAVRDPAKARSVDLSGLALGDDAHGLVRSAHVDVVVELIGGIEPARTLIIDALKAGKPVITANKELLANFGAELYQLSADTGCALLFEAAVGGAIPLVRALQVSLLGERVRRVVGIVNGTTNFILSQMARERISYAQALAEAELLGYAEADPTADVAGYDAAAKAAILAGIAFNTDVVASDVYREGIEALEIEDIEFASRLGYEVKLLAVAERTGKDSSGKETIGVRVHPTMVPIDHPLASVHGPFNAAFIEGENAGELMLYGRGAGGHASASAVLGDLLEAARTLGSSGAVLHVKREQLAIRPIDELQMQYYVAIDVADRPGVLADVAAVFGLHKVSIRSMEQVGLGVEARMVFITHLAREADVQATLADLHHLDAVERIGGLLRVIGSEG